MKYGIIVATYRELEEIKRILIHHRDCKYYDLNFYEGEISEKNVVIVKCGVGKVNAARTAQMLIDKFEVDKIINIGVAGGINPELHIKDIVIGNKLVQYDFDTSAIDNTKKGEIEGIGIFFESDKKLVDLCKNVLDNNSKKDYEYKIGTIATADNFCADSKIANSVRDEFGAECIEMEGAAIAQVCYLDKKPFLVIRGISDSPNGNNGIDYTEYCRIAAKQVVDLIKEMLKLT